MSQINSLPGLVLWITGDSVQFSSGTKINLCYDLSPTNNSPQQPSINKQPIRNAIDLNGHKSISFDGVDDYLEFLDITDIRTVFWVEKENNSPGPNLSPLLGHSSLFDFHRGPGTVPWASGFANNNVINGTLKMNFTQIDGLTTPLNYQYTILSLVTTNNVSANNFSNDRIAYGRSWSGELWELIIFNQALSTQQVIDVEKYLHEKYSPILELGSNISVPQSQGCIPSYTINLHANPDFQSFLWNTGATTNQINVSQYGEYSVICTDIFGINHYDTVKVIPTPKNFNYPPSNIICGNNSITWNTLLNNNANQFQWQDNSVDSLILINSPGQYFVTVTDTLGCVYNSNTVTITQDNFPTTAFLGPDTSLCSGNAITLTNGASAATGYTWNTGSTNDSLYITNPGQYSVIVTNTNNCVAKDTINVTIQGLAPAANFSTSVGCQNKAVSFTNLSSPPPGNTITSTYWDFGDLASPTNTSTVSNPFHTFSDTGTYTVRLNVTTDAGCQQAISRTIHIAPNPTVNFSIGNSCQNDSTAFANQSSTVSGYPIASLIWNFGDPSSGSNSSSLSNPKHLFSAAANYTITLTTTNNKGCSTSLSNIITVKPQVKADFIYSTPCTNTNTLFQDNSIASSSLANTRSWNFGNGFASGLSVSRTYTATGPYNVSLTVNVNGCSSTKSKIITIFSPPVANFILPVVCAKDTFTLTNTSLAQSGIINSNSWKLNSNAFSSVQNPTLTLPSAGNYPVKLIVSNSYGCLDSVTKTVIANPLPDPDFITNPPDYYYLNEPVQFIPVLSNASVYNWILDGISTSTLQIPTLSFTNERTYTVSLKISDGLGCQNVKTKTLIVSKRFLDLAVLGISTVKDDDGFMTVVADIANYGTVRANSMELQYQISDGGNNKETWTGSLNPNSFFTYTFNSQSAGDAQTVNPITCVTIQKVNGVTDEKTDNNQLCSALFYDEISVSNPYPNPTSGSLTLPVILNKDIEMNLSIYNSTGQLVRDETSQKGLAGLNFLTIPTENYSWGAYLIKVVIDDKVFIKKFIKTN